MNKEDITRIMFQFVLVRRGYIYLPAERVAAAQEELAEVGDGELLSYITQSRTGIKRLQLDRVTKSRRIKLYDVVIR
jgi:hypothetical protein